MRLLTYEGYRVVIAPEALALKPFKRLWQRDKSAQKDRATSELGYIYFFADPRSEYQYIVDDDERSEAVKEGLGLPKSWKPDRLLLESIALYSSFTTSAALLLRDMRFFVDNFRKYLRSIDFSAVDKSGKPIYAINAISSALEKIPAIVRNLDSAEKAINDQLKDSESARGTTEMGILDSQLDNVQ